MTETQAQLLTTLATVVLAIMAVVSAIFAWKAAHDAKQLSRRQLLIPLWQYMTSMEVVKPSDLVEPDVKNAINALELVALCCEGGMIDEGVIKRTFKHIFISQYQAIESCPAMTFFGGKDGKGILLENPATQRFYKKLINEHLEDGALKKA